MSNVDFRVDDVMEAPTDDERFDVVYVRFLLTHLTDPAKGARTTSRRRLAPGGVVVVEDIDCTGHFCQPHNDAFWRYVEWYRAAARSRGVDPDIGPRLPGLLADAGLSDVGVNVVQPAGITGEVKLIAPITLEAVAGAILAADLATHDELARTVDDLYAFAETDGTLLSLPRIVQAWGRRRPERQSSWPVTSMRWCVRTSRPCSSPVNRSSEWSSARSGRRSAVAWSPSG